MAALVVYSILVLQACCSVLASPLSHLSNRRAAHGTPCTSIDHRKEWRDLTVKQQQAYIQAVHCFQSLPPKNSTGIAISRFEEFQAAHIAVTPFVHFNVGHFLPFHRQLVTLYNNALRAECGYEGPGTYWHWTRDVDSGLPMEQWPIFDAKTGFGGDGVPGTYTLPDDPLPDNEGSTNPPSPDFLPREQCYKGCVQDGPFANLTLHLGPGKFNTERCLVRGFDPSRRSQLRGAVISKLFESETYEAFRAGIDVDMIGIHTAGHAMVGGEVSNLYSAGGDPLFYFHHSNLDRLWWLWQEADREKRLYDLSGPTDKNDPTTKVTLDFELQYPGIAPSIKIRNVMDSLLEPNCFTYEP